MFSVQQYDLERVELIPVKINVKDCFSNTYKEFAPLMKEAQISFLATNDASDNCTLYVDVNYTKQVMYNVLTNAKKFTPAHGRVSIHVSENTQ